jgi:hypothetical protein
VVRQGSGRQSLSVGRRRQELGSRVYHCNAITTWGVSRTGEVKHRLSSVAAALSLILTDSDGAVPCCAGSRAEPSRNIRGRNRRLGHQHSAGWGWAAVRQKNGQAGGGRLCREMRVVPWRERRRRPKESPSLVSAGLSADKERSSETRLRCRRSAVIGRTQRPCLTIYGGPCLGARQNR